jgi:restriction system protein
MNNMPVDFYAAEMMPAHERFAGRSVVGDQQAVLPSPPVQDLSEEQPHPLVITAYLADQARLRDALLARIHVNSAAFFERLVIDVFHGMGYGGRARDLSRCLGRSHDGGVDGVIARDELGLDLIYVQAKRLRPGSAVPVSQVRDFVGSLSAHKANSGIFVTTGRFSPSAHEFAATLPLRLALVDGPKLADIMIRHNIGVTVQRTYQFKAVEAAYFRAC